jgi:hypothetical protein
LTVSARADNVGRIARARHAWLIWHVARYEDAAVNAVLRGVPQILERDNVRAQQLGGVWARLRCSTARCRTLPPRSLCAKAQMHPLRAE